MYGHFSLGQKKWIFFLKCPSMDINVAIYKSIHNNVEAYNESVSLAPL